MLSGLLLWLVFPRAGFTWLAPFALIPLLAAAEREPSFWRRFAIGEAAGILYWFGICNWIQFVLAHHGGMGELGGWGTFALFCLAKALHMAVFTGFAGFLSRRWWSVPMLAALWAGLERTHGEFGFAWLMLGNAASDMEVPLRLAPFTGVYGISFLFVLMSAAIAGVALRRPRRELLWLVPLPMLYLLPAMPAPEAGRERVLVEQPNFDVEGGSLDYNPIAVQTLSTALGTRPGELDLIVWPEAPAPLYFYTDQRFREDAMSIARRTGVPFLFGTVAFTATGGPLNSATLLSAEGEEVSRYDKMYLVPFGEFVPPLFGFVNRITDEVSDFVPGDHLVVSPIGSHKLGTFICYESAFPELARRFVAGGAEVLVNISNDGYFGGLDARQQHLLLARMRAAENRRWLIRATNDGITAAIDPAGRVTDTFPEFQRRAGKLGFSFEKETTFYSRTGDWFAWGALAVGLAATGLARRGTA
jgi:apolipoprotein N-acyltransferase